MMLLMVLIQIRGLTMSDKIQQQLENEYGQPAAAVEAEKAAQSLRFCVDREPGKDTIKFNGVPFATRQDTDSGKEITFTDPTEYKVQITPQGAAQFQRLGNDDWQRISSPTENAGRVVGMLKFDSYPNCSR